MGKAIPAKPNFRAGTGDRQLSGKTRRSFENGSFQTRTVFFALSLESAAPEVKTGGCRAKPAARYSLLVAHLPPPPPANSKLTLCLYENRLRACRLQGRREKGENAVYSDISLVSQVICLFCSAISVFSGLYFFYLFSSLRTIRIFQAIYRYLRAKSDSSNISRSQKGKRKEERGKRKVYRAKSSFPHSYFLIPHFIPRQPKHCQIPLPKRQPASFGRNSLFIVHCSLFRRPPPPAGPSATPYGLFSLFPVHCLSIFVR
jgi:hypothetical protein